MSSFQPPHDLVFGSLNFDNFNHNKIFHDLMEDHTHHHPSFIQNDVINFSTLPAASNHQQKQIRSSRNNSHVYRHKRVLRKDLERKRRQEMSELYTSLRSLLPLHLIKGKRSISDHMVEAVNYIEQMKKRNQDLQVQRDKLEKKKNGSLQNSVMVNLVGNHVDILISCSYKTTDLGLSKVFVELLERDLSVVNCVSTKAKEKFLHHIKAKASDMEKVDLAALQQKLSFAID